MKGLTIPRRMSGSEKSIVVTKREARKIVIPEDDVTRRGIITNIATGLMMSGAIKKRIPAPKIIRRRMCMCGCFSEIFPPKKYPIESAIMTIPIMLVQTKIVVPKYGASRRDAEISIAITHIPDKNAIVINCLVD